MCLQVYVVLARLASRSTCTALDNGVDLSFKMPSRQVGGQVGVGDGPLGLRFQDIEEDFGKLRAVMLLEAHSKEVWKLKFNLGGSDMATHLTVLEERKEFLHALNHLHLVPCV